MSALQCAASVLATLPRPSLLTLKVGITSAKAAMETLKAAKVAMALGIDAQLIPMKLIRTSLETAITTVKNSIHLVPAAAVAKCDELGMLNVAIGDAAAGPIEYAEDMVFNIERLTAGKLSINLEITQLDSTLAFFDDVLAAIDSALTSAT